MNSFFKLNALYQAEEKTDDTFGVDVENIDLEQVLVEMVEGSDQVNTAMAELDEVLKFGADIDEVEARLSAALECLEGEVSQGLLNFLNQEGDLTEMTGLESIVFDSDEKKAEIVAACQESLKDGAKAVWDKIAAFFKWLAEKVANLFKMLFSQKERHIAAIAKLYATISKDKSLAIPKDKTFSAVSAKSFASARETVVKALGACENVSLSDKKMIDSIRSILTGGFSPNATVKKMADDKESFTLKKEEGTAEKLGWNHKAIESELKEMGTAIKNLDKLKAAQKRINEGLSNGIKGAKNASNESDAKKAEIKELKTNAAAATTVVSKACGLLLNLSSQIIVIGKMFKAPKAKGEEKKEEKKD